MSRSLLCCIGMATFNPAFGAEDPLGADALAMGSSAIALSRSNAVTAVNPGLLGLEQRYDFEGSFVYGPGKGTHWMGAAVDGRTSSAVGLGFIYSGDVYETAPRTPELPGWTESGEDIENVKRFHDFTLGMAIPMFQRRLALGFNGNLSLANHDLAGKSTDGNGDVGLAARPVDGVTLGDLQRRKARDRVLPLLILRSGDHDSASVLVFDDLDGSTDL